MGDRSNKVDAYIAAAAESTRPVMEKIREMVHKACPGVEEDIKWNVPWFVYKGPLLGMTALRDHVTLGFWKMTLMEDPDGLYEDKRKAGKRTLKAWNVKDLPAQRVFVKYVKQAVDLNERGVNAPKKTGAAAAAPPVPKVLAEALSKNAKAKKVFEGFPPSAQRDYIFWIMTAKQEATRQKRLATTIEWVAEGKQRNWKYSKR